MNTASERQRYPTTLSFRVSTDMYDRISELAEQEERSLGSIGRRALVLLLDQHASMHHADAGKEDGNGHRQ